MPPIPANQLLNQHLDNVGIALRSKKPFTPNDFPAVRKYEQVIKNQPVEHAYVFDSTGMPVGHSVGTDQQAGAIFLDKGVDNSDVAMFTHNHPAHHAEQMIGLSLADIRHSLNEKIPIRAVVPLANQIHEFQPGGTPAALSWDVKVAEEAVDGLPITETANKLKKAYPAYREQLVNPQLEPTDYKHYLNDRKKYPDAYQDEDVAQMMAEDAVWNNKNNLQEAERYREILPQTVNPQYQVFPLPRSIPDATMAADSFAIQRKPKPLIAIEPGRSSAGSYDFDAAFAGMMNDRLARYGY